MPEFSFKIISQDSNSRARTGIIKTRSGEIKTPYLIPVATRAEIISLNPEDIKSLNLQTILANTYHLHFMPPGDKEIKKLGGLHKLMKFPKPIFTDSGGFQALSLRGDVQENRKVGGFFPGENFKRKILHNKKQKAEITEEGIWFSSIYNNTRRFMSAENSMQIQSNLCSDVIMAFDQCNFLDETEQETKEAMERSHRWEIESLEHRDKKQALYGIIHGGTYKNLREESSKFILNQQFEGIAIGGSMGKTKAGIYEILDWISPLLQHDKRPRHLLGIGWIEDLFECIDRGIDTFDCVQATRTARHGCLYIPPEIGGKRDNNFSLKIRNSRYAKDNSPINQDCSCQTCTTHTRAKLREMYKSSRRQYYHHATIHNLHFIERLTEKIREAIEESKFRQLKKHWLSD